MKYVIILFSAIALLNSCSENKAENSNGGEDKNVPIHYPLTVVENKPVSTSLKLPAQFAAYEEVYIFPKVNGYVKEVLVDIGSKVTKGSLLMTLEAPELVDAVSQAREKYARAKADFSIDKEHYQRLIEAARTPGAISPLDISTIKAKVDADSALCNAEKSNWDIQQTMLAYLKVTAPFSGIITERNVNPGALVSDSQKDKPMLQLKMETHLRLQVDIPEDIAGTLKVKDSISFYTSAFPGKRMVGLISRISDNINEHYRSERMEIDVQNPNGDYAPGMYVDVVLNSNGNANALSVPKSSVITSTERKYVLLVRNNKISKVDVSTGNASMDKIEIYGPLQAGDKVILKPNDEIKEGAYQ